MSDIKAVQENRKNMEFRIDKTTNKLTIEIDLNKLESLGVDDITKSGKSYTLASSGGFIALPNDLSYIKLSMGMYASKDYVDGVRKARQDKPKAIEAIASLKEKDSRIAQLESALLKQQEDTDELRQLVKLMLQKQTTSV